MKRIKLLSLLLSFCCVFIFQSCLEAEPNEILENQQNQLELAQKNFSDALAKWNNPENFKAKTSKEADLNIRLLIIQEPAKNLLIQNGLSKEVVNQMNNGELFLTALDFYQTNSKNK